MQEDFLPQSFAQRVMEGLSKKTIRRLRKMKKDPMRDAEVANRPTAIGVQPFSPWGGALGGTAGTSGVAGMHGHW